MNLKVSLLSAYNAQPRQGHWGQVLHIFSYLNAQNHSTIVINSLNMTRQISMADLLTKPLVVPRRKDLLSCLL